MAYIPMTEYETASDAVKREYDDQIAKHGRITNMKRTLLHNVPAFKAYMEHRLDKVEKRLDRDELRNIFLHIYSNPVLSKERLASGEPLRQEQV